jgi:4-amino-4-deoxy-L-arabinose transferase-like glycosyltransferase
MNTQSEKPDVKPPAAPATSDLDRAGSDAAAAPPRRVLWLASAGIFLAVTALVAVTAEDLGLTWDEPPYIVSQMLMARWFGDVADCRGIEQAKPLFAKEAILDAWEYNRYGPNFHPPLAGMLCNVSRGAFGWLLGDLPARRVASGAELALAAAVLFMFLARRYSYWVGGIAAASLVLMPRVFGDAHIAGTDLPLMAFWGFTALAFWNGLESRAWRVGFGVLLGLSLLVKFTALLLVVPLVVWLTSFRAIPARSTGGAIAALLGTVIVGWPLGLAGLEIVRLAHGIRRHTQQERMLGPTIESIAAQKIIDQVGHAPPFTAHELRQVADKLHEAAAAKPPKSIDALVTRETADAIRHFPAQDDASHEKIQTIVAHARREVFLQFVGHAPSYSDSELKQIALVTLDEAAAARQTTLDSMFGHAAPFTNKELKKVAGQLQLPALALDQYVAYVMPKQDLGVTTRVPGWIFLLPLVFWLMWKFIGTLPFAPRWLRETGGGLELWLAGLAIAPAVAIALNPTWWHETLPQLAHYYQISVGRQGALPDIEIFYLGKKYIYSLPWHNGWVLIAVTVPAAVLVCSMIGVGSAAWNWRRDSLGVFFVLNMLTLPVSRMLPTPAHDGVRLMLPTFFFLAGLAGLAFQLFERVVDRLRSEEFSTAPVLGVAAVLLLGPPSYWLSRSHPHELSYYNGVVGGLPGAQRLGFEPTYWYDAVTPDVLRELNDPQAGLPLGATLSLPEPRSILDATMPPPFRRSAFAQSLPEPRVNPEVFDFLKRPLGRLRSDIRLASDSGNLTPPADQFPYVALLTHSSKASPFTRLLYALDSRREWGHDGVRLFSLYDPRAVARAWALWLLLDATDYSQTPIEPRIDRELVELSKRSYRATSAAALLVTEHGIDAALESQEDAETMSVIRKLADRRDALNVLLARRKESLIEAVEMISRTVDKRPDLLDRLIETYDGYLPANELGDYLDEGLPESNP